MSEDNITTPPPLRDDSIKQNISVQPGVGGTAPFTPGDDPAYARRPAQRCMGFKEAVATCFKKYATFKGRATRAEFWWFQLFTFGISVLLSLLNELVSFNESADTLVSGIDGLFSLATLLPDIAVSVRRLHDRDHSGWWLLSPWIVACLFGVAIAADHDAFIALTLAGLIIIGIVFLIVMCRPSGPANKYGEVPCAEGNI